jgi:hypothetical protein
MERLLKGMVRHLRRVGTRGVALCLAQGIDPSLLFAKSLGAKGHAFLVPQLCQFAGTEIEGHDHARDGVDDA